MVIKKPAFIMRPTCGYCNGYKKLAIITRPICRYCIFKMALWKLQYRVCRYCTMFILIFVNPKQINVAYSYGPI
jgi:hypothetical protein